MKKLLFFISLGVLIIISLLSGKFNSAPPDADSGQTKTSSAFEATLSIPSLEISAPIVFADFPGTAFPGQIGNVYIVGHSSDYPWNEGDYKTVFSKLPDAATGILIKITYQGDEFIYEVLETKIVEAGDLSVLDQPNDRQLITLQTSYPVGSALKRFIMVAKLLPSE